MPSTPLFYSSGIAGVTAISGSTETVVATLSNVVSRYAGQNVNLHGFVLLTTGTTTTAVVVQIRRASLTGTQVGDHTGQPVVAAAGSTNGYDVYAVDTPGDIDQFVYVLTVTNTGGGTGGTTVYAFLEARVD